MRPPDDFLPRRLVVLQVAAKPAVFASGPWEDGDEPPAGLRQMREALARAELAVGDIEEVGPSDNLAQRVPGGDVRHRVAGLAGIFLPKARSAGPEPLPRTSAAKGSGRHSR